MSSTPSQSTPTPGPAMARTSQLQQTLRNVSSTSARGTNINNYLGDALVSLRTATHADAGILWLEEHENLRWLDSFEIESTDAVPTSEFTQDVVANATQALSSQNPDILACDLVPKPDLSEVDDPRLANLVLSCRQLVIPVHINGKRAVYSLFQSKDLSPDQLWGSSDVSLVKRELEQSWAKGPHTQIAEAQNTEGQNTEAQQQNADAQIAKTNPQEATSGQNIQPIDSANPPARTKRPPVPPLHLTEDRLDAVDDHGSNITTPHDPGPSDLSGPERTAESSQLEKTRLADLQRRALELGSIVGRNLDETACAFDIANEVQHYLGRGRVSVAVARGRSCVVKAVSNQPVFDPRSSTIKHLSRLADRCLQMRHPIYHPSESFPSDLQMLLDRYYDAADTQSIALLPLLKENPPSADPNDLAAVIHGHGTANGTPVGVVVIEGLRHAITQDDLRQPWSLIQRPLTHGLANARQHSGLFLMPVWTQLSRFTGLFRGHTRSRAFSIVGILIAFVAALIFVPSELKIRCEGKIQPIRRSRVFAETDGVVQNLQVKDGDLVQPGQVLLTLDNPQLLAEIADAEGEARELQEQLTTCKLQRMRGQFATPEERQNNVVECAGLTAKLQKIEEKLALLKQKESQLTVRSQVEGRVITWDAYRRLNGRPVESGQRLLTIADPSGPWELELRVPDKRTGNLRSFFAQVPDSAPKTSYVLASNPTEVRFGTLRELARSADIDEEFGNIVRAHVDIDPVDEEFENFRPGTEVIAHIHVGRASLGYCKLHEFLDWTQRLWFRYL